jgi:hypothetical protein
MIGQRRQAVIKGREGLGPWRMPHRLWFRPALSQYITTNPEG